MQAAATATRLLTMRAAVFRKRGGNLEVDRSFPVPSPGPKQLLIKVIAASVNPVDYKIRASALAPIKLPKVTGSDGAGTVVVAPPGSKFHVGDEVMFLADAMAQHGAAAEYTVQPEDQVALKPKELDWVAAASLPLVSNTAWQALAKAMPLAGKRVLIHAGSGGVGSIAVQIAKAQGAHVTTTCSTPNVQMCRDLGAEEVIDYAKDGVEAAAARIAPGGFDVVVSCIPKYDWSSFKVVRRGGHLCHIMYNVGLSEMAAPLWGKVLTATGVLGSHTGLMIHPRADGGFEQVARLVADGKARAVVGAVMPLEEAAEAQARVARGSGVRGKVVLRVVPEAGGGDGVTQQ